VCGIQAFRQAQRKLHGRIGSANAECGPYRSNQTFCTLDAGISRTSQRLDFLAGQADNDFAVGIAASPACLLAPEPVSAGGGAFNCWGGCPVLSGFSGSPCARSRSHELHPPHRRGIQELALLNALALHFLCQCSTACRSSDRHGDSPFSWVESLNSFILNICASVRNRITLAIRYWFTIHHFKQRRRLALWRSFEKSVKQRIGALAIKSGKIRIGVWD
jgi:hypothetical protein